VYRTKRRFVLGNLEAALSEEPRPGAKRKLSGKEQANRMAGVSRPAKIFTPKQGQSTPPPRYANPAPLYCHWDRGKLALNGRPWDAGANLRCKRGQPKFLRQSDGRKPLQDGDCHQQGRIIKC
jgi:hypothetical protein